MFHKLDHIALKVEDITQFSRGFLERGYSLLSEGEYPEVGMKIAFLGKPGETAMELLQVTCSDSPAAGAPMGLHHTAVGVTDIEAAFRDLSESGLYEVEGPVRQGAHARIFFFRVAGSSGTLFECVEQSPGASKESDNE